VDAGSIPAASIGLVKPKTVRAWCHTARGIESGSILQQCLQTFGAVDDSRDLAPGDGSWGRCQSRDDRLYRVGGVWAAGPEL